ncbi:hypothetical protein [Halalkalibacter akibai]|uniref:Uncharacterized protein n=1 Tax=Halalkalibacter akibai (strain ATCC 43226 / DSM 21942 / CIP 109018 / JCM 9157 / 1139) TaxID=1236973 RepID=W4QV17_HALA3|nr:hypothetical protein [Halalkalibacter akibai]GAE35448.1 hypothetical protein JCM9157_2552 [Halalkalibacter akibai JCM 9157]
MIRLFFVFCGFIFAVVGGISILAYLNLLTTGYGFGMYLEFIVRSIEFYVFIIGVVMIIAAITVPSRNKRSKKK